MLSELVVRDFRCFAQARLALHPAQTVLVGRNAQGKTSLLEALCVLMRLQSPRTSAKDELIRFEAKTLMLEGQWNDHALRCGMSATARRLAVDGAVCARTADYLAQSALVVWMDHADMNLLRGGAEHRRRYLDFALSQADPGYAHALQGYNRALRSRNYLLKRDAVIPWRQVDAYAKLMDGFHAVIVQRREQMLREVEPQAQAMLAQLSGGTESLGVVYAPGCEAPSLLETLLAARAEEERTRSTLTGCHRDDVRLLLHERSAESFASEGQQRSISLALKMAQARWLEAVRGCAPMLLIDDVFGELDPVRRRALLAGLPAGTQCVMTTTHLEWAESLRDGLRVYEVQAGGLMEA